MGTEGTFPDMSDWDAWRRRFGLRLSRSMRAKDMTQRRFARMIGVSEETVTSYTQGHSLPRADTLAIIAAALHVDVRWLLGVDGIDGNRDLDDAVHAVVAQRAHLSDRQRMELGAVLDIGPTARTRRYGHRRATGTSRLTDDGRKHA